MSPSPSCAASAAPTSPPPPIARPAPACRAPLVERWQRAVTQSLASATEVSLAELGHGHRVYLLDGSSFSMVGPGAVPGQGVGQVVPAALGGGDQSAAPETDVGNGRAALHDGGGGIEGIDDLRAHLGPGTAGGVRGGAAAAGGAGADQLRGRLALAAGRASGRGGA